MRLIRDIDCEGPDSYIITTDDTAEGLVRTKYPKAFVKRIVKYDSYCYQVRISTSWFTSKPLGDTHLFKDQVWDSAYQNMRRNEEKDSGPHMTTPIQPPLKT